VLNGFFLLFLGAKGLSFIAMERPAIHSYKCSHVLGSQPIAFIPLLSGLFGLGLNQKLGQKRPAI